MPAGSQLEPAFVDLGRGGTAAAQLANEPEILRVEDAVARPIEMQMPTALIEPWRDDDQGPIALLNGCAAHRCEVASVVEEP